jgi:hypothetical protein
MERRADREGWSLVFPSPVRLERPSRPVAPLAYERHTPESVAKRRTATGSISGVLIGYARCSTDKQDLAAHRHTLHELGVSDDRVYLDHGMTGRNRKRPVSNKHSPPCARATRSWYQSSTGSRAQSPTPERSATRSPPAG